jgi:L-ascorbate metabolism protein UlaG (beta-lactamase superfamily)
VPEGEQFYLTGNVVAEPLFAGWYVWPHLISPATCAMNVVGRHLKIMDSFIQAPQVHAAAVKNPKMMGGPFIDQPVARAAEIKRLREETAERQRPLIRFAEAVRQLTGMLQKEAAGFSLNPLYDRIPEPLRGYVELAYDLQGRPSYRFYEPLLYRSEYYDRGAQSLALHRSDTDDRPFVLSTPRLPDGETVPLNLPFDSPVLDDLFRMRSEAGSYSAIREALRIPDAQEPLFRSFFTTAAPRRRERYQGEGVRVRYFGHACLLVETRDVSILSDPIVSYPHEGTVPRFTWDDLPPVIDYVVITHNHQDHVLVETLLQLRPSIRHVVVPRSGAGDLQDPSLKLVLKALGFPSVIELDELESIEVPGGRLTGVPFMGEHADLNIRAKLCHHASLKGHSVLFAADSSAVDPMVYRRVQEAIGNVDVLFLGMECDGAPLSWLYGPLLPEPIARDKDRDRRLAGSNYEQALQMVERFSPREVYVYAMGLEPWLNHIMSLKYTEQSNPIVASNRLVSECQARGIPAERLFGRKEMIYGGREQWQTAS